MSHPRTGGRRAAAMTGVAGLAAALLVPFGLLAAAAPATAAIGECPPGYLPGPHVPDGENIFTDDNVAVFAGGDFLAGGAAAESEGLLVAMGDATFDKESGGRFNVGWVGVGSQVAPTPGTVMLAVGGELAVGSATVLDVGSGARDDEGNLLGGGVRVGGVATPAFPAPQYELNNGTMQVGMGAAAVSDWATFGDSLTTHSTAWAASADTGTTGVSGQRLTFTSTSVATSQFFTVAAADLNLKTEVFFENVPDDASVVINVVGAPQEIVFSPNYFADDDVRADDLTSTLFGEVAQRTMWNFADATSVTFGGSSQFLGSVMAPNGSFDITASMNGRVYAGVDVFMHGVGNELHNYPWNGDEYRCIPIPSGESGSVQITKVLETAGVVDPDREFYGWMECTGEGIEGDFYQEGSIRAGETITVAGLPIGSVCEIFEDSERERLDQEPLPPGFIWAEPVWSINGSVVAEPIFTVVDPDAPVQVEITMANTLLGRFSVTKVVDGPVGGYVGDRTFEISYACDTGAFGDDGVPLGDGSESGAFELAAGETATSAWYPVGTVCDISEETPATEPGDFDGDFHWETPTIDPATVTIGDGDVSPVAVTVTNTYAGPTPTTGSFSIDKVVENADGLAFDDEFTGAWSCTLGEQVLSGDWSVSSTGAAAVVDGIPLGAACTVTEQTPANPAGGTWSAPVIAPASFTVDDGETVVAVTVTNTLDRVTPTPTPTPQPPLPATGTTVPWWAVAVGGGLLVAGAAVVTVAVVRRRRS